MSYTHPAAQRGVELHQVPGHRRRRRGGARHRPHRADRPGRGDASRHTRRRRGVRRTSEYSPTTRWPCGDGGDVQRARPGAGRRQGRRPPHRARRRQADRDDADRRRSGEHPRGALPVGAAAQPARHRGHPAAPRRRCRTCRTWRSSTPRSSRPCRPRRTRTRSTPSWPLQYAIRRYGFHGTSHNYVSHTMAEFLGKPYDETTQIVCHLGNGASISAIKNGVAVDTSMGLTPLEGLVMGTRSGDIDPGIIAYLHREAGLSMDAIDTLLNKKSGMLGMAASPTCATSRPPWTPATSAAQLRLGRLHPPHRRATSAATSQSWAGSTASRSPRASARTPSRSAATSLGPRRARRHAGRRAQRRPLQGAAPHLHRRLPVKVLVVPDQRGAPDGPRGEGGHRRLIVDGGGVG